MYVKVQNWKKLSIQFHWLIEYWYLQRTHISMNLRQRVELFRRKLFSQRNKKQFREHCVVRMATSFFVFLFVQVLNNWTDVKNEFVAINTFGAMARPVVTSRFCTMLLVCNEQCRFLSEKVDTTWVECHWRRENEPIWVNDRTWLIIRSLSLIPTLLYWCYMHSDDR